MLITMLMIAHVSCFRHEKLQFRHVEVTCKINETKSVAAAEGFYGFDRDTQKDLVCEQQSR
jgi:hypothetical protein